jgi:hypothetical protein
MARHYFSPKRQRTNPLNEIRRMIREAPNENLKAAYARLLRQKIRQYRTITRALGGKPTKNRIKALQERMRSIKQTLKEVEAVQ